MEKFEFKPKQWVLVRDYEQECWALAQYSHYKENAIRDHRMLMDVGFRYCIPYEGNEHLLGTKDPYVLHDGPKDGDFVKMKMSEEDKDYFLMIYHEAGPRDRDYYHACMYVDCEGQADNEVFTNSSCRCNIFIPATDSEKELLISKLHENGKEWNADKKEIVDWWKPQLGEICYAVAFGTVNKKLFYVNAKKWESNFGDHFDLEMGYVFRTEEECQAMCDKLNEAISDVK